MIVLAWIVVVMNLLMLGNILLDAKSNGGTIIVSALFLAPSIAIAMAVIMGVI